MLSATISNAPKQRRHPRRQVRQADILGEEVVGAEPQARDGIQLAVAGREKNDGQLGRHRSQVPAQVESTLVLERNIDDGEIGQMAVECLHGSLAVGVTLDRVAMPRQGRRVILAQSRLILDDGDVLFHR